VSGRLFASLCRTNFTADLTNRISYFIGADATGTNQTLLLSGDANLVQAGLPCPGSCERDLRHPLQWDATRHRKVIGQTWF